MRYLFSVLLLLTTALLVNARDDDVQKEFQALRGPWKTVALEAGGMRLPKESVPDFLFIVEADGKAKGQMGKTEYQAKISVDPAKTPKTITNAHQIGPHHGKQQFGVYKVEEGKWIVCMTAPGVVESDRPTTFDTKDTRNVVFIFEKVEENKKP
jgi:uncharacterized protein (TIGR03067 family)